MPFRLAPEAGLLGEVRIAPGAIVGADGAVAIASSQKERPGRHRPALTLMPLATSYAQQAVGRTWQLARDDEA